ncbi:MAG: response regulator [Desulfobacterales bacterium]|nr:response regulator [Desulfobacterales bacterium]
MGEQSVRSIRAFIVDDDKTIGEILKERISRDHISVEVFTDGLEVIEFVKKEPGDIIIADLMMPRVGGLEVLRQAKIANPDVIVIIITGHASIETAIEAVREGAYDYIKKPFKLQEIEIVFNNAVDKVNLVRENRELLQELGDAYEQLVAIKKENNEFKDDHEIERKKMARINFFSSSLPSLEFLNRSRTDQRSFLEQLQNISMLKKEGLLTEREFKSLKGHLIKAMKTHE